jgi:hypothetical protein
VLFLLFVVYLALVKNHIHEWNKFTSWFIDWKILFLFIVVIFIIYLLTHFFIICVYSKIEFIKPLDDVKIQQKTITFTKDYEYRTIFINKIINSGIMKMFIIFFSFYIYIFYFVSEVLYICTNYHGGFSMRNISFFNEVIYFSFI